MLAGQAVELVPAGLLVGDVDAPLDVDEGTPVAAARHMVAELERPAFRGFLVIDEDLKPRGLALDAAFGILELHDQPRRHPIGLELRVAVGAAFLGQPRRSLGCQIEIRLAIAQASDADAGWIL